MWGGARQSIIVPKVVPAPPARLAPSEQTDFCQELRPGSFPDISLHYSSFLGNSWVLCCSVLLAVTFVMLVVSSLCRSPSLDGVNPPSYSLLHPKFQPCPHIAAPFFAEVVSLFPKDLQSLLVEAWMLCWLIAASPCSPALPPYPLLLIPMQVIPILPAALTASPILENPFLGSPVIQHQVEACLPCFKDMSLALSLLCFLAR